jgi:hypothetical protein
MSNHEDRPKEENVHLFIAIARKKDGEPIHKCIRVVIRDYNTDLAILEAKLKILGGTWRIHQTVNSRDTEKARKYLLIQLILHPEWAGCIDSIWKTALLQSENKYEGNFLLDIDTQNFDELTKVLDLVPDEIKIAIIKTPNGHHLIAKPFDTRKICELPYVTLIRDGYIFVKKVGE